MTTAAQDISRVEQMIGQLPADARSRVHVVAQILRDLLNADERGEVELALTLILAELANERC